MNRPIYGQARHRHFLAVYEANGPYHDDRQRARGTDAARAEANRVYDAFEAAAIDAAHAAGSVLRQRFGNKIADHIEDVTFHATIGCIEFVGVPE